MINWRIRAKNPNFWAYIIPAAILLIQAVADLFGFSLDLTATGDKLLAIVNTVLGMLTVCGVIVDPTTEGIEDSAQAMTYQQPKAK